MTQPGNDGPGRSRRRPTELRLRVLEALMFRPPTRRTELSELLDTSVSILSKELGPLAAAGVVTQSVEDPEQRAVGARGRPPVFASLAPKAAHAIGLEIGNRAMRAVICDLSGAVITSRTVPWFPVDPEMTIDRAHQLTLGELAEAEVELDGIVGLGLSSAQALAPDRAAAGAFAHWVGVNPAAELAQRLGVPTTVERAAIAGALAEQRFGAGRGMSDLMYVRLSAGCGLGFIVDGEPYRGTGGVAGEVAHIGLTTSRRLCYCGRQGCLETVASSEAVAAQFGEVYGVPITVPRMLELIRSGDRRARRIIAGAGSLIGEALAPAVSLMNPAGCIVGGELSLAGEVLLASIRREIVRSVTPAAAADVTVVRSQRGHDAEVIGAALMQLARAPRFLARRVIAAAPEPEAAMAGE